MGEVAVLVLMWSAIYGGQHTISGLTLKEMITYVLIGNIFYVMIRNFLASLVAGDIKDGNLSMALVRPMSYFSFIISREIGRISVATIMSILSQAVVILFFAGSFIWNFNILRILLIAAMVILAFITELLLSYLVGLIAFWVDETDGLYATIERVKKFFSGGYFPISLLPLAFVKVSFLLPFAYSFFVPAQIYLNKMSLMAGVKGLLVQIVWIAALYGIIKIVWNRGLKRYEGVGI